MQRSFLIVVVLLLSIASAEIIPSKIVIQPLTINPIITVKPAPSIQIPTIPIKPTIPVSLPTEDSPCGIKGFCGQATNFKTKEELKAFTNKNCPSFLYLPMVKTSEAQTSSSASGSTDFSGTNNQQANVDQADILKTDGQYIYSVSGNILSIIKAYPYQDTKVMSTLSFTSAPSSMFIEGNYLAIFGTDYEEVDNSGYPSPLGVDTNAQIAFGRPIYFFSRPYTWVYVYDLCKKDSPKLIKDYKISGYYFNGRKSDATGFVYLLSQLNCNGMDGPWYEFGQKRKNMTLQQIFYYPNSDYQGANFINIFAFNLRNPLGCQQNVISVLSLNTYILYMSQKYIYLTSTQWLADAQATKIHKIYVSKSKIIPMADGSVSGYVNNQFSLDEYNGTLRIATTQTGITGVPSNNVFCLDTYLNTIGSLRNIAKNQTIYSARYVDTRLYLVTFRRIDPFFVIDLSNHKLPAILGQLKITGFSNYLHPYDNKTVIGFGQQTNDQGQQIGLKVSLFDVTNVNSPQSVADFVLQQQYVYSAAQWQHKAFLFSREKNLMVVPASYYDWQNSVNNVNSYNGALVFYIKRDAAGANIQLRGIVNHLLSADDQFWDRQVERSLYIENLLYTKSRCLLRIHTLSQLNPVVNLKLNCDYQPIIEPRPVSSPVFNPPAPAQISGPVPVV